MSKKYRVLIEFKEGVGVGSTVFGRISAYHFDEYAALHLYNEGGGETYVPLGDHILFITITREETTNE